ncbi:MAG: AAA family ATPase [Gemmatimonadetes bacterium]|nr:AAA family ATPase [Gemmatimonadota bacterium]
MQLTLATLGSLQATSTDREGTVRPLGRGKPVAMLAYLACIPGHRASREHLAALLWGDVDSDAARQNLRQTIWYLKKKLGDGLLDVTGEMIGLAVPCACDRDEFVAAAQRADFAAAIERYTGPFIPDFAAPGAAEFEQWCELERRRLMVTFLRCADALTRQWLSEGRFRDAQELARRARDVDPMDQATWRLLLEALMAGSDGLGAASEAEHFESFLAREEQEAEVASLAALRAARRTPTAGAPITASPSAAIAAQLVGREVEFSRVLSAWESARAGTPRVLVISAGAGLGKTRLLRDVCARLRASRSRCVLTRANPGDRHLSGGFLAEVVSQLVSFPGAAAVSTGTAGVLVALAPALASTYPSASPDPTEGEDATRRRALALVDLARAVSDEHPAALLLDDLHWADEHSARVLAAAFSHFEDARLLVVIAKRPSADPRALFAPFERLDLPPLDLAAVSAFVTQVAELPSTPWADVLPQQLLLATGGSPLLLVETLHDALEQGWLSCGDDGAWHCDDPARITASLREGSAVRQRVQRLAPAARRLLLVLSVVGRPVEAEEASAMAGGDTRDGGELVETLERGGFVMRDGAHLVTAHDEIADAVVEGASDDERRAVHADVAREMLARASDEMPLRLAAEHAAAADDRPLLQLAWHRFLPLRRQQGDRRGTRRIAADFLGVAAEQRAVLALVAATPWWKRQRTRWFAAAGVLFAVAGAAIGMAALRPAKLTSDFAVWVADSAHGTRRLVGVRIDPNEPWLAGEPLHAVELDSTDFPAFPAGVATALRRLPSGREWRAHAVLPNGGDEVLRIDSLGQIHPLLTGTGDDAIVTSSPDGRFAVGISSRYDTLTDHGQLVVVDPRTGATRRLTKNVEADYHPVWRPDGAQVQFIRRYFSRTSDDAICFVDFDGSNERCLSAPLMVGGSLFGWIDHRTLLGSYGDGRLFRFDAITGQLTPIPDLYGQVVGYEGDVRSCWCSTAVGSEPSLYLFPATDPAAARPVLYRGQPLRGTLAYIGPLFTARSWLDTLRLERPSRGLSVENTHSLRVEGRRANGAPARVHDLRWSSRDSTVATVDSLGVLRPRRIGRVWVIVSAGGWRTDSALIEITAATSRVLIRERWDAAWTSRWTPFGDPRPRIVSTPRGPAFLPNGDGSYQSGAYSSVIIPSAMGAGLEALVSMPVTRLQWQSISLNFGRAETLAALRRWDHRTGDGTPGLFQACWGTFPGDEGGRARKLAAVGEQGTVIAIDVDTTLYNGAWRRVRVQLLPDGRCAMAIDGVPVGVTRGSSPPPQNGVFLHIVGHSAFDGRLVIGPLEAWSGVRGGVDWTRLDALAPPESRR